jgi:vacuolar-type H+-ATPase subunit I/STV1
MARRASMLRAMPRAAHKLTVDSAVESGTALVVHRSAAQLRLESLEQEHERLLREIKKKRASRDVVEREARDAASELAAKLTPLRTAYAKMLHDLRTIFEALLGADSHLNKRDKARVRRLYGRILPDLEQASDAERDERDERDAHDFFGRDAAGDRRARGQDEGEAGYSATKPSEKDAGLLRSLFRKLAVALHPDKVQDAKERDTLTAVMKEVTRAYEARDVARLVEIERTWLAQSPAPDRELDVARRITELLSANKELRRQLRALTAELKELKQSLPSSPVPRRRGKASARRSEVDELIEQAERELDELRQLRDFAQRFADGHVSITEFLLGPELLNDDDDPFEQMLAEVLEAMTDAPRPGRGRRHKRA